MSITSRITSLQSYQLAIYRGALHPEFFEIEARRRIRHGEYDFEAWVFRGGHVLRFQRGAFCATEVVTEDPTGLPDRGLVAAMPCAGERDHEADLGERVTYMASMQTETLTGHLYLGTHAEMQEHARSSTECMITEWSDDAGHPNLSLVDMQRYADEVHVQSYHLRSDCSLVLRTQTIFQLKKKK